MTVTIRPAIAADHAVYLRLFAELGIPDPPPGPARFADAIVPQMSVACEADGTVVGYVTWRPYGPLAHVIQVAVDPRVRGQRIGERLLEHVRGIARAAGCTRWYLNVKRDNTAALALYDRVGLRFELESTVLKVMWAQVPRVDVCERLATRDEDAALAALFGLPAERVAMFRERRAKLVTLRDEHDIITGFAPFDATFPGTPTFCAVRPELAVPLLEAMRHHAEPTHDFVRVVVEGNRDLANAVLVLGAELTFEVLRLGAPLVSA